MSTEDTEQRAEKIASDADDVRAKTRTLVVDAVRHSADTLQSLPEIVSEALEGAWKGLGNLADDQKASVFREVIDGVSEGVSTSATAIKLTAQEAQGRGKQFAKNELKGTADDLRTLESLFTERISKLATSSVDVTSDQAKDLIAHAKRIMKTVRPTIESAVGTIERQPIQFAKESATVAAGATRKAAGSLLQGVAGVLDGLGDIVGGSTKEPSDEKDKPKDG